MNAVPLSEVWVCEDCGEIHVGKNPPNMCGALSTRDGIAYCPCAYFENGRDIAEEGRILPKALN